MCEELHDPFTNQVERARYRAERDMLAQTMERVADDIERTFLGFEDAEDATAMRWAREFRAALGSLHAAASPTSRGDASDVTMSAHDLLPEEEREAAAWVREHGGLDSVKKLLDWVVGHCSTRQQLDFDFWLSGRVMHELGFDEDMADRDEVERRLLARLMPEGYEWLLEAWPMFEDGEPVRIGDEYADTFGANTVATIEFGDGYSAINPNTPGGYVVGKFEGAHGRHVPRPAKVLDADGAEIRVGDTVYLLPGDWCNNWPLYCCHEWDEMEVTRIGPCHESDRIECKTLAKAVTCYPYPSQLTHRAPVIAADGKPLLKHETVYEIKTGERYFVTNVFDGTTEPDFPEHTVECRKYEDVVTHMFKPSQLTHTKPEIDTWERIEEDAAKDPCDYFGFDGEETCGKCPASGKNCEQTMARDIVRRCRALAGVDE